MKTIINIIATAIVDASPKFENVNAVLIVYNVNVDEDRKSVV